MRVVLEIAGPAEILSRYYPNGKQGGMTVDGRVPGALGEHVELVVRVLKPRTEFNLIGQLAWARHKGSRNLKECFGVDFLARDESSQRLLNFARLDLDPKALRAQRRIVTDLPVRITHQGVARKEFLMDLSIGGAFVRSHIPLHVGDEAMLQLRPPGAIFSMSLSSRVTWVRSTGEAPGMGLMFLDEDPKLRERLNKVMAKIASS